MSLFTDLEQAAGVGAQGGGNAPAGAIGAVTEMLQSYPGGIGGIVQQFEKAGLGGVAQSWIGSAQNQSVTGDQVQSVLGTEPVAQVASKLGVSPVEAAGHIAQFLPLILDHLSPGGQAAGSGGLGQIEGLLSRFGGRAQA